MTTSREKLAARKNTDTVPFERPEGYVKSQPVPEYKPVFYLQIVDATSRQALADFPGGGAFERNMVQDFVERVTAQIPNIVSLVMSRKVGFWHTRKQVEKEVAEVVAEALPKIVEQCIADGIYNLKAETLRLV